MEVRADQLFAKLSLMRFVNRTDAGQKMAEALKPQCKGQSVVVFAIPRGGVVLGAEIARVLKASLDLVIVRKVGHPFNPEYAVCVVTDNQEIVCDEKEAAQIDPQILKQAITKERAEARRRHHVYLSGRPAKSVANKTAVLVDDGAATGLTFLAALKELKRKAPKSIIAALPIVSPDVANKIIAEGVRLVALDQPKIFLVAVGAYYDDFSQVEDEQVVRLLNRTKENPR